MILKNKTFQKNFIRVLFVLVLLQSAMVGIAYSRNIFCVNGNSYAAILISDDFITKYDLWVSPATYFAASPSWTHYFNNRKLKTRWYFRAKRSDLIEAVKDVNCVSIVLVGHGTRQSWDSTDGSVTNFDLRHIINNTNKKAGEWFQLTCATDEGLKHRLGELVMAPDRVYSYQGKVNSCGMIFDAFSGFRYIKSKNST